MRAIRRNATVVVPSQVCCTVQYGTRNRPDFAAVHEFITHRVNLLSINNV